MRFSILFIRYKQIQREIISLGFYIPVVFIALILMIYYAGMQYQTAKGAITMTFLLSVVCLSIEYVRKDKLFLIKQLQQAEQIKYIEYALLTFPFAVGAFICKTWYFFLLLQVCLFVIAQLNFRHNPNRSFAFSSQWIAAKQFEWKAGLRKNILVIAIVYIMSYAASFVRVLPIMLLWFFILIIVGFFTENESLTVLRESGAEAKVFVRNKLKYSLTLLFILMLPVLCLATYFNPDLWLVHLLFLIIQLCYVVFVICFKYNSYMPNQQQQGSQIMIAMLGILSLIPFCFPIPLFFAYIYYHKSIRHLSFYLND